MRVRIIVDSTADLRPQLREKVTVIPLRVSFGSEEFVDGLTLSHTKFYEKLVETDVLPHTSQASPGDFAPVFDQAARDGVEGVVLTLSSTLSGTYQSACIAAEAYDNIHVVDSRSASIGSGILAELALELAGRGHSAAEIVEALEQAREEVLIVALLDTLEYLKRGGRISKTAAFAGGVLNIKPVISLADGTLRTLGKARGSKQGGNLLAQEIEKAGGADFSRPILLGYTGLSDALLQKYIKDSAALWEQGARSLPTTIVGSVIGTHAGPGAIAVAFFRDTGGKA